MRKKNYKGRCEKRQVSKCEDICRTYDDIQRAYLERLEANKNIKSIRCNVPMKGPTGKIVAPCVILENGDTFVLDGLIAFNGDPYAEIERLYARYKRSVPNRHEKLNTGYFKALSSDALTMGELMDNVPRPQARMELEGFILLASAARLIPWKNPRHFFWQSSNDPDCIVYRDWIIHNEEEIA